MGKFVFRLQSVFDLKSHGEKEQKDKFSRAVAVFNELERRGGQLEGNYKKLSLRYLGSAEEGIRPQLAAWYHNYFTELRKEIEENAKKVSEQAMRVEAERAELARCIRERKTIGALRDKQYQQYIADEARAAEKQIDEMVAARRFAG